MPLPSHWAANFTFNQNPPQFLTARMICPHCDTASTFRPVASHQTPARADGRIVYHLTLQCDHAPCRKIVYVVTTKSQNANQIQTEHDEFAVEPSGATKPPHVSIPAPIGGDWTEARKAFNVAAHKAAAVMCRRVLYGVLLDRKCKEHPLHEGIAELAAKERLPKVVENWLREIKEDGHDAAHPHRALDVPVENVAETMEYTKELLRFVYIEPFELQQRLARKAVQP